jgi:UDP-N-acetylglucosamine transferase subunit ALG13
MIFVTVGTQLSFDRLIVAVDAWSRDNPGEEVFSQIGPGTFKPKYGKFEEFLQPDKANELFQRADLIVAHAGMGSILTALKYRKPILVLPRRASLWEHRNEHQLATAKWLGSKPGVFVANDAADVAAILTNRSTLKAGESISDFAEPTFANRLKGFIDAN